MTASATRPVWSLERMPFHIGALDQPHNPEGLPDVLPFSVEVDLTTGRLVQRPDPELADHLDHAYRLGSLMGTAMDDTPLGHKYANDFLAFVTATLGRKLQGLRVLEIGAGRGYLVRLLLGLGADAIGIEPGVANQRHWERHAVGIVVDSFPSERLDGPFDLIIAYAVLEHVSNPLDFLAAVKRGLSPDGHVVMSVPDTRDCLAAGDPSMLVHEHHSYFTPRSLSRTVQDAGLDIISVRRSGFGGATHFAARPSSVTEQSCPPTDEEVSELVSYGRRCGALRARIGELLRVAEGSGRSVGVYCPSRGLALLPTECAVRFFDDDRELEGRYYPPFIQPIESRRGLQARPVDVLWVLSHTFGERLSQEIAKDKALRHTEILTVADLASALG